MHLGLLRLGEELLLFGCGHVEQPNAMVMCQAEKGLNVKLFVTINNVQLGIPYQQSYSTVFLEQVRTTKIYSI